MFRRILLLMLLLGFSFTFAACTFSSTTDNTTIQQTTVSTSLPSSLTTQTPENPELIEINDYVSGLKQNAVYDSFSTDLTRARRVRSVGEEEASNLGGIITDVPLGYRASYQKITTDAGIADITFWGANSNYIFPGSLVKIATPDQSDVLVPIVGVRRAPYVISSGLEGASGIDYSTKNIQNGTLSEVRTAINDMMKGVLQEGAQLPFNLSTTLTEIKSADELSIALGVSVKVQPVVSVKNQFEFENQKRKTYAVLVLKQVYYTIEADYPIAQGATGFFAANETKARIQAAIKTGDVPAYVSSVSYGRIVIITIKTDYSMQEIENKLKVKVNKGPAEVGVSAELEIDNEDESMELNYFVLGGSIEDNQAVLSASSISEALAALNSKYDPKKTIGVPISYKVSHLSDGSLAKIGSSSEYYAKILEPIPVENLYFQEQHRFSQLQLGSSNVLLNATKYPNEAILFPVTYMIQGAQVQNFHESILKDSDGNTIAKISTVRGEDKFNHKYYLQVSDNLSHIGKEVSIIAKSGNEESILTFRIVKVPVSSVGWTVNTQSINTAPPGAEIDLEATVTPSNASYKNLTFEIKIGLSYAEIIERIHPTSGKVVGYILKISNEPNANGRTVVVVAKADGVESIELSITIQKIPVSSVEISNNRGTTSMSPGLEAQLFVQVNPRNATYQSAQFLAYHIISGSQYIELSQGGLLKINSNAIIGAEIILRAEVDGVFSDDYVITVIDTIAEMVDILPVDELQYPDRNQIVLSPGSSIMLKFVTSEGTTVKNFSWSIEGMSNGVSIAPNGTLNISNLSTLDQVMVKISITTNYGVISSTLTIFIIATSKVELYTNSIMTDLLPGQSIQLQFTAYPNNVPIRSVEYRLANTADSINVSLSSEGLVTVNQISYGKKSIKFYVVVNGVESNLLEITILDAYFIYTFADIVSLFSGKTEITGTYHLMAPLPYDSGTTHSAFGTFNGILEGNGHTISGLSINIPSTKYSEEQYFGLFKQIGASGIIRNVVFDNGIISSGTQHSGSKVYVGLLAGANKGLVEGIQIRNSSISVHRSISNTGGIVGHNSGIIRNSLNSNGTLFINGSAGSIAGVNMDGGLISRCTARDMNITYYGTEVSQSVGGLLGYNYKSTLEYSNVYNMTMTYDGVNSLVPRMGYVLGNLHDGTIREIGVDSSTGATNSSFKSLVSLKKSDGVFGIGNYDFTTYFFAKYNKMVGRVQGTNVVA